MMIIESCSVAWGIIVESYYLLMGAHLPDFGRKLVIVFGMCCKVHIIKYLRRRLSPQIPVSTALSGGGLRSGSR